MALILNNYNVKMEAMKKTLKEIQSKKLEDGNPEKHEDFVLQYP
jgi:hypothetical protein